MNNETRAGNGNIEFVPSQLFFDVVGSNTRDEWNIAYYGCIDRICRRCGAAAYAVCINPATNRPSTIPCLARLRQ